MWPFSKAEDYGNDHDHDSGQPGNKRDGLQGHPDSRPDDYVGCQPGEPTVPRPEPQQAVKPTVHPSILDNFK